jgi:signal transduction histidine kinase
MRADRIIRWMGMEQWSPATHKLVGVVGVLGLILAARAWWLTLSDVTALQHQSWDVMDWALLCVLTIAVSNLSIKIVGTRGIITVSDTFLFTSVLLFGGPPSVALGWLDGVVGTLRITRKPASVLYSSSMMAVSMTVASGAFEAVRGQVHGRPGAGGEFYSLLIPLAVLTVIHFGITTLGVSTILSFRGNGPILRLWRRDYLLSALTYVSGAVASGLIYSLVRRFGMTAFFGVAPFILFIYWTYRVYSDRLLEHSQGLERMVAERTRALEAANERLRELDRVKTEFLNVVAHDLRTPLTSIMAYAQLMVLHPDNTGRFPQYAKTIFEESNRLRDLVNSVLDLSKMEVGKVVYEKEPVQLEEIIEHFFKLFQSLAASNGVHLQLKRDGELPTVFGDRNRLGQALGNLLNNAVKFTREDGCVVLEARTVELDARPWVEVRISDQGPGVPEEDRERIFEKYHTVQQQTHIAKQGTGLGLPIAKQIIEAHGGVIGVDSNPGEGSTFWFLLPARSGGETSRAVRISSRLEDGADGDAPIGPGTPSQASAR